MVLVFLGYCSYSYTEIIGGTTANAAKNGLSWTMNTILPQFTGISVNAVSYRYTAVKDPHDPMVVSVQNSNAQGTGYIFRTQDDWTGLPGNTITKTIPTDNIPIQYWGPGEMKIDGKGEVLNPYVLYSYRYDTCFGPVITDPRCPGYRPNIPTINYSDPLNDEFIKKSLENKLTLETEEEKERNSRWVKKEPESKKKSDVVSSTIKNALLTAEAAEQAATFQAMNTTPNFALYFKALPGGVYQETIKYVDKGMPDSKNRLKLNFSQEQLHNRLTGLQYNTNHQGLKND